MAINGVTGNNSILLSALGNRRINLVRPPPAPVNPAPNAAPTVPTPNPVQQNAQLVNETLLNPNLTATTPPFTLPTETNPFLTEPQATQGVTTPQPNSSPQVTATLQNLNFAPAEPANAQRVNEIPPTLYSTEIARELDLIQQNALPINEPLPDIGVALRVGEPPQPLPPAAQATAATAAETRAVPPAPPPPAESIPIATPELIATTATTVATLTTTYPIPTLITPEPPVVLATPLPPQEPTPATAPPIPTIATPEPPVTLTTPFPPQEPTPATAPPIPTVATPEPPVTLATPLPPQEPTPATAPSIPTVATPEPPVTLATTALIPPAENIPIATQELAATTTPTTAATPTTLPAAALTTTAVSVPLATNISPQELTPATAPPTQLPDNAPNVLAESQAYAPAEAATPPEEIAIRQNALLVNETLQNLDFTADTARDTLLTNTSSFLTALQATQELTPTQQSALAINTTLQNLSFVPAEPTNILLINEIPPALEATGITEDLDLVQQTVLQVNETLQDLGVAPQVGAVQQALPPEAQVAAATLAEAGVAPPTPAPPTEIIPVEAAELAATTVAAATATTPPTPTVPTPEEPVPLRELFPPQRLTPATLPVTLFPYRAPGAFAVYQVNDPAPPPRDPEPSPREVKPTQPITPTHPVANSRLRQMLLMGQEGGQENKTEYNATETTIVQAEKSIRYTINQANMEIDAQGLPLHLVFAKHGDGFALDVYDCSPGDSCQISYDVPIQLDNLPDVLDNLQHGHGLIVNNSS